MADEMLNLSELVAAKPAVMGILNITPDSFSDGGRFLHPEQAIQQAVRMAEQGAAIIDIGGESTRPGAAAVSLQQELDRVVPVIQALTAEIDLPVSIDTSKPAVMDAAVSAGAEMVNDVNGLQAEGALAVCARHDVPVCIMHMQGEPRTMQSNPAYPDGVISHLDEFFTARIQAALDAGVRKANICIDPGFGFGKTLSHNFQILQQLDSFGQHDVPVLVGVSRKSMIGNLLSVPVDARLPGSLSANVIAFTKGASIFRVHDVKETVEALRVAAAVNNPDDL